MLKIRPLKESGEWGAKCRKVYDLVHARIYDRILERCTPLPLCREELPGEKRSVHQSGGKGDCIPRLKLKIDRLDKYPTAIGTKTENAPALVKKIGKTAYVVRVHFSETSKENMSD